MMQATLTLTEAEEFFYRYASGRADPEGRARLAIGLAEAEERLKRSEAWVDWQKDPLEWDADVPAPRHVMRARLVRGSKELGWIGQIGLDDLDGPGKRVTEAELAEEFLL
jgi:hypothetical protein